MTSTTDLYDQLDEVTLHEEELFRKRQALVHHAIQEETPGDLHERYLEIRNLEAEFRFEHLRLENLLRPGRFYQDHGKILGTLNIKRKYMYLFLMAASAGALLWLMART